MRKKKRTKKLNKEIKNGIENIPSKENTDRIRFIKQPIF